MPKMPKTRLGPCSKTGLNSGPIWRSFQSTPASYWTRSLHTVWHQLVECLSSVISR